MFIITKEEFISKVWPLRDKEKSIKGKINKELFVFTEDANKKIINKRYWKDYSVPFLEKIVYGSIANPKVDCIYVSTEYFDWKIIVFKR